MTLLESLSSSTGEVGLGEVGRLKAGSGIDWLVERKDKSMSGSRSGLKRPRSLDLSPRWDQASRVCVWEREILQSECAKGEPMIK